MQINKIQSNSFQGRYQLPVTQKQVTNFEAHVAPLFENCIETPIRAFYDGYKSVLFVSTGKKDVDLLKELEPETYGVFSRVVNNDKHIDKYIKQGRFGFQSLRFKRNCSNVQFKPLENFKDLIKTLFNE